MVQIIIKDRHLHREQKRTSESLQCPKEEQRVSRPPFLDCHIHHGPNQTYCCMWKVSGDLDILRIATVTRRLSEPVWNSKQTLGKVNKKGHELYCPRSKYLGQTVAEKKAYCAQENSQKDSKQGWEKSCLLSKGDAKKRGAFF
jgi:hypothetical protein